MAGIESIIKKIPLVSLLKKSFPSLYRVGFSAYLHLRALFGMPRYLFCRWTGRVYFGPVMLGAQTWATRYPHMQKVIGAELAKGGRKEDFRVLEIGSWAGQSGILWATEIARSGQPGKVMCVDPWMPFVKKEHIGINTAVSIMDRAARRDKIFPLFWHNVKSSGMAHIIVPLRGKSTEILPLMKPALFDLAFVDGSHAYSDFLDDLRVAAPLVKEGGLICGDDMELQQDEVDFAFADKNREADYVTDPKTGQDYHPGVARGVGEFFQRRVSCRDGFWALRKKGDRWEDVDIQ